MQKGLQWTLKFIWTEIPLQGLCSLSVILPYRVHNSTASTHTSSFEPNAEAARRHRSHLQVAGIFIQEFHTHYSKNVLNRLSVSMCFIFYSICWLLQFSGEFVC